MTRSARQFRLPGAKEALALNGQQPIKRSHVKLKIVSVEFGEKCLEEILVSWLPGLSHNPKEVDMAPSYRHLEIDQYPCLEAVGSGG